MQLRGYTVYTERVHTAMCWSEGKKCVLGKEAT